MRSSILLAAALLFACATPTPEPEGTVEAPMEPPPAEEVSIDGLLVSGDWLQVHLDAPNLAVLHVGNDPDSWTAEHIPGQVYIALEDIAVGDFTMGFSLPPEDQLRAAFEAAGVSDDTQIVLTGDLEGLMATRAFLSLEYLGRSSGVALLDGGLKQWREEGRPVAEIPVAALTGELTTPRNDDIIVTADFVEARIDDEAYQLVDARPPAEFSGEVPGDGVARPGHIPSAIHLFWKSGLQQDDRPHLHPVHRITELYSDAGVDDHTTLVAYCRTGMQASFGYFLGRLQDRDTLVYDGSFVDWSSDPDRPIIGP